MNLFNLRIEEDIFELPILNLRVPYNYFVVYIVYYIRFSVIQITSEFYSIIIIIFLSRVSTKAARMFIQMWASQQMLATSDITNQFTLPQSLHCYIVESEEYTIHSH